VFEGDYNTSTAVYFWNITNKDGNVSHTDVNYFNINAASGVVSFRSPADMEDNGSINPGYYEFDVVVADKDVNSSTHPVLVRVVPVNEAPIMSITGTFSMEISEDNTSSFTLTATDPENDSIFWSTSSTPNGTALYSTNQVTYTPNLNFTGIDTFDVNASDGTLSSTLVVTVNVLPVNDAPTLTTEQIGPVSFPENSTGTVYSFSATDVESDNSLLSLSVSGSDSSLFYVSKTSTGAGECNGTLHFFHPPDFETKRDVGSDGYYDVNIVIKDEGGPNFEATGEIPLMVYVTDQQEAPVFDYSVYPQSFPIAFAEDNASRFTLQVRDPDSKSGLTWSIPDLQSETGGIVLRKCNRKGLRINGVIENRSLLLISYIYHERNLSCGLEVRTALVLNNNIHIVISIAPNIPLCFKIRRMKKVKRSITFSCTGAGFANIK
jgi:hypothetical protein